MRLADILAGGGEGLAVAPSCFLAYARVSTSDQADHGTSLEAQTAGIRTFAEDNDFTVSDWYVDSGVSAFHVERARPEFEKLMERALADDAIAGVICHSLDRFSRDASDGQARLHALHTAGKRLLCVTETLLEHDAPGAAIMEGVQFGLSEEVSRRISFHTRKGLRQVAQTRDAESGQTFRAGGAAPWGYKRVRVERGMDRRGDPIRKCLLSLDDGEVSGRPVHEWTRDALLMRGSGASLNQIRDFLNGNHIPPARKPSWGISSVRVLFEPDRLLVYSGHGVFGVTDAHHKPQPPSSWIVVEQAHPPIISVAEAETIQAVNEQCIERSHQNGATVERLRRARTEGSRWLITGGLAVCACGENLVGQQNKGRGYYSCAAHVYRGVAKCPPMRLRADELDALLWEAVESLLLEATRGGVESDERKRTEKKLAEVDVKIGNVRTAILNGLDDVEWANGELAGLKKKRAKLVAALGEDEAEDNGQRGRLRADLRDLPRIRVSEDHAARRRFLRGYLRGVRVDPTTRRIGVQIGLPGEEESRELTLRVEPRGRIVRGCDAQPD